MNPLKPILEELDPVQRYVLVNRFGLDGNKPRILRQIGAELKIGKEAVRQHERRGLLKLRHPSRRKVLKKLLEDVEAGELEFDEYIEFGCPEETERRKIQHKAKQKETPRIPGWWEKWEKNLTPFNRLNRFGQNWRQVCVHTGPVFWKKFSNSSHTLIANSLRPRVKERLLTMGFQVEGLGFHVGKIHGLNTIIAFFHHTYHPDFCWMVVFQPDKQ